MGIQQIRLWNVYKTTIPALLCCCIAVDNIALISQYTVSSSPAASSSCSVQVPYHNHICTQKNVRSLRSLCLSLSLTHSRVFHMWCGFFLAARGHCPETQNSQPFGRFVVFLLLLGLRVTDWLTLCDGQTDEWWCRGRCQPMPCLWEFSIIYFLPMERRIECLGEQSRIEK